MKHIHWIPFIYNVGCPPCKVRQLRYGFRVDPEGYEREIEHIIRSKTFTQEERHWILTQVGR